MLYTIQKCGKFLAQNGWVFKAKHARFFECEAEAQAFCDNLNASAADGRADIAETDRLMALVAPDLGGYNPQPARVVKTRKPLKRS